MNLAVQLPINLPCVGPFFSDDVLIAAIARGDRVATATLLARHSGALRAAIRAEIGERYIDAVDGILYDVSLVLLFGTATSFQPARDKALPWLVGVARTTTREHLRGGSLVHYDRGAS